MVSEAGPKVIAVDSRGRAVKNRVQAENMKKAGHHRHGDTLPLFIFVRVLYRPPQKNPQTEGPAASFLVDIPSRWEPRTNQSPTGALIAFAALSRAVRVLYRPPQKNPQTVPASR